MELSGVMEQVGFLSVTWQQAVMWVVACVLLYLAIARKYEPYLLVPIGFGVLLVNMPMGGVMSASEPYGLIYIFYQGIHFEVIPPLIFLGLGAMTDFGPMLSNPKLILLGAGAQFGVFLAFFGALFIGFDLREAASIGIIGGADGPTAIFLTNKLARHLLGSTAVAAYSYMALVPVIIPPIIRLCTTKAERCIVMPPVKPVSQRLKVLFPIASFVLVVLLVPPSAPLMGMLMLGNLFRESGVVKRLSDAAQNEITNIATVLLGLGIASQMQGEHFLKAQVLGILVLGVVAFCFSVFGGVMLARLMNLFLRQKINPMVGAAGLSAVPMAARVVQVEGMKANPRNYLLMHAMGPNVAGVIGTLVAAGMFLALL